MLFFFVIAIPQDSSKPRESHFTAHQPPSPAITRDNQSAVSLVRWHHGGTRWGWNCGFRPVGRNYAGQIHG